MRRGLVAALALLLLPGRSAWGHRLDEYLQATILTVESDSIEGSVRLIPGVAVADAVIGEIDTDRDGVVSAEEQKAYALRTVAGLSVAIDGVRLYPTLVSVEFPRLDKMREGVGEIHLEWRVDVPHGRGHRQMVLQSGPVRERAVYLVNALVPSDKRIRITGQARDEAQTTYRLDYQVDERTGERLGSAWWDVSGGREDGADFGRVFRLGMRHIAGGTDHLLFLLTLLLPAPLVVCGSRWGGTCDLRRSLGGVVRVVTAFTVGHSATLVLAGLGLVAVPSRAVEVLIAASILISAVHAWRPLFPGREAWIAGTFGLVHGLAFAATISELGLEGWERIYGIAAFNLGIEAMQMILVGVALPALLVMSRTHGYVTIRMGGAILCGLAAAGWIGERLFHGSAWMDGAEAAILRNAGWMAAALVLGSAGTWWALQSSGRAGWMSLFRERMGR